MLPVTGTLIGILGQNTYTWPPHVAACVSHGMEAGFRERERESPMEQGRKHIALLHEGLECLLPPYSLGQGDPYSIPGTFLL